MSRCRPRGFARRQPRYITGIIYCKLYIYYIYFLRYVNKDLLLSAGADEESGTGFACAALFCAICGATPRAASAQNAFFGIARAALRATFSQIQRNSVGEAFCALCALPYGRACGAAVSRGPLHKRPPYLNRPYPYYGYRPPFFRRQAIKLKKHKTICEIRSKSL